MHEFRTHGYRELTVTLSTLLSTHDSVHGELAHYCNQLANYQLQGYVAAQDFRTAGLIVRFFIALRTFFRSSSFLNFAIYFSDQFLFMPCPSSITSMLQKPSPFQDLVTPITHFLQSPTLIDTNELAMLILHSLTSTPEYDPAAHVLLSQMIQLGHQFRSYFFVKLLYKPYQNLCELSVEKPKESTWCLFAFTRFLLAISDNQIEWNEIFQESLLLLLFPGNTLFHLLHFLTQGNYKNAQLRSLLQVPLILQRLSWLLFLVGNDNDKDEVNLFFSKWMQNTILKSLTDSYEPLQQFLVPLSSLLATCSPLQREHNIPFPHMRLSLCWIAHAQCTSKHHHPSFALTRSIPLLFKNIHLMLEYHGHHSNFLIELLCSLAHVMAIYPSFTVDKFFNSLISQCQQQVSPLQDQYWFLSALLKLQPSTANSQTAVKRLVRLLSSCLSLESLLPTVQPLANKVESLLTTLLTGTNNDISISAQVPHFLCTDDVFVSMMVQWCFVTGMTTCLHWLNEQLVNRRIVGETTARGLVSHGAFNHLLPLTQDWVKRQLKVVDSGQHVSAITTISIDDDGEVEAILFHRNPLCEYDRSFMG